MQKLRSIHLYLGCIFAPLLLFFAVSGFWQMVGPYFGWNSHLLQQLTTIHTARMMQFKDGSSGGLTSVALRFFTVLMALGFIITTVLGIAMAVKFGKSRRTAFCCLALGIAIPLLLIFFAPRG